MDQALRLKAVIVDLVGVDGNRHSRELYIDVVNSLKSTTISRLKMYGYQYLMKTSTTTQTLFTFSPGHVPYSHHSLIKFIDSVNAKKDAKFYFDSTSMFSAGFTYKGGIFNVVAIHGTTSLSITIQSLIGWSTTLLK